MAQSKAASIARQPGVLRDPSWHSTDQNCAKLLSKKFEPTHCITCLFLFAVKLNGSTNAAPKITTREVGIWKKSVCLNIFTRVHYWFKSYTGLSYQRHNTARTWPDCVSLSRYRQLRLLWLVAPSCVLQHPQKLNFTCWWRSCGGEDAWMRSSCWARGAEGSRMLGRSSGTTLRSPEVSSSRWAAFTDALHCLSDWSVSK